MFNFKAEICLQKMVLVSVANFPIHDNCTDTEFLCNSPVQNDITAKSYVQLIVPLL